jgi:hypothetical protein
MNTNLNQPVTMTELLSAYFVNGMHRHDLNSVLNNWDNSDLALVHEALSYAAPMANMMMAAVLCVGNETPGQFLYEVAEPFGSWFVEILARTKAVPHREDAYAKMRELVIDFYSEAKACDVQKLVSAVSSVHGLVSIH